MSQANANSNPSTDEDDKPPSASTSTSNGSHHQSHPPAHNNPQRNHIFGIYNNNPRSHNHHHHDHDDDQQSFHYLSEPSISEDIEDSTGRSLRSSLLSPMEGTDEDEDHPPPPPPTGPPPPRSRSGGEEMASPGNTSISSWESHFRPNHPNFQRVRIHFSPEMPQAANTAIAQQFQHLLHPQQHQQQQYLHAYRQQQQQQHILQPYPARKKAQQQHRQQQQTGRGTNSAQQQKQRSRQQSTNANTRNSAAANNSSNPPSSDNVSLTSSSDVASKEREQLDQFLHQLRQESAGALTESFGNQSLLNTSIDDSVSDRKRPARRDFDSVIRGDRQTINGGNNNNTQEQQQQQHHRISSVDTELIGNTSDFLPDDITDSGQQQRRMSALTMDDTINMTLSASEDDDDVDGCRKKSNKAHQTISFGTLPTLRAGKTNNDHADDHTLGTATQQSSTDEDDRHMEQHSADDEQTAIRPPRIRTFNAGGKPAHRRTRSGDSAAAKLAMGGLDWRGMDKDRIPFPDADDDDDDDDEAHKLERHSPTGKRGSKKPNVLNGNSIDAARFSLGSAVAAAAANRAAARRHRREHRQQQRAAATLRQQLLAQAQQRRQHQWQSERNIYAHYPPPPPPGPGQRRLDALNIMNSATVDEPPPSELTRAAPRDLTREESSSSVDDAWGRSSTEPNKKLFSWLSTLRGEATPSPSTRKKSLLTPQWASQRVLTTQEQQQQAQHFAYHDDPYLAGQDSFGFLLPQLSPASQQDSFQRRIPPPPLYGGTSPYGTHTVVSFSAGNSPFLPTNNIAVGSPPIGLHDSSPSPIKARASIGSSEYGSSDQDDSSGMDVRQNQIHPSNFDSLQGLEDEMETETFRPGSYQHVLRHRAVKASPFMNFGRKVSEGAKFVDRSAFLPTTSVLLEQGGQNFEYPTYECPRCGTLQREFFTVSSAPRQYETAAGYLALYFAIYVIASLYIFGLEEGWPALDCIYFAVITLTTAGLGDYVPTTSSNKIICSIFIYFGVACIGLLLGSYIASMLDESSRREARQNRLDSCPNCARLQNIKDAAERRQVSAMKASVGPGEVHEAPKHFYTSERTRSSTDEVEERASRSTPDGEPRKSFATHKFQSERVMHSTSESEHANDFEQGHKKIKRRHENPRPPRSSSPQLDSDNGATSSVDADIQSMTGPSTSGTQQRTKDGLDKSTKDVDAESTPSEKDKGGNKASLGVINSFGGQPGRLGSPPKYPSPPKQSTLPRKSPPDHLGSPMTHQILGRQSHTRHASIDVGGGFSVDSLVRQRGPRGRGFTQESPAKFAPTICEDAPYEGSDPVETAEPKSKRPNEQPESMESFVSDDYDDSTDDSSIVSSSDSVSSEGSDIAELSKVRVKTAKYVVLTLRQALVNSMVIIAVGCLGFWFVEGFTLVDSWYFTTVLLTTVGYGDIVPVTKGGKLFATVYILVAGTILLNNMSLISMIPLELRKRRIERAVLTQFGDLLDDDALRELASGPLIQRLRLAANRPDGLHECSREMFALAMLVRLGKVTEQDILETFAAFRRLDVNNDGVLNSRSIIAGMIHRRRTAAGRRNPMMTPGLQQAPPPPPPDSTFMPTTNQILVGQPQLWTPNTRTSNADRYPIPNTGLSSNTSERDALLSGHNNYDSVNIMARSQ